MLVGTNSSCILCLDARDPHSTQRISMATVRVYKRAKIQHSYSATAASTTSAALRVTDRAGVQPSETRCDLVVPRIRLQLGNRAFSVAGPVTWNSLPLHNRSAPTDTSVLLFLLHWLFRRVRAANIVPRFCSNSSHVIAPYKLSFYYCYYYYYYYYYYYLLGETQCHAHGLWPAVIQPGIALVGRFDCLHTVIHVIHHSTTTTAKIKWCY